jgi:hypothetical protein
MLVAFYQLPRPPTHPSFERTVSCRELALGGKLHGRRDEIGFEPAVREITTGRFDWRMIPLFDPQNGQAAAEGEIDERDLPVGRWRP